MVERDERNGSWNYNAHLLQATALPGLRFGAVDLENSQPAAQVGAPVRERVDAGAEDVLLTDALLDRMRDRILDEPGPDRESETKRLARRLGKLARELSQQRGARLAGQAQREVINHQRVRGPGMDGAADSSQRRGVSGPGFVFDHLALQRCNYFQRNDSSDARFPPARETAPRSSSSS